MITAITICVAIPALFAGMAWWANRHHAGKMHMLWGKGSTMGDAEAEEEWERAKFVRMDIDKLDKP